MLQNPRWLEGQDASKEHADLYEADYEPRPARRAVTSSGRRRFPATGSYEVRRFHETGLRNAPRYGITEERFWDLVKEQGWRCPICSTSFAADGPRMVVDHNHETGEVRGVLCSRCNVSLGAFGDSPDRLRAALAYLAKHGSYGPDTTGE